MRYAELTSDELQQFQKVQQAARHTLDSIMDWIKPGVTEADLVHACDQIQREAGVDGYWFKSLPALVLVGRRTCLCISNTPYVPGELAIQDNDLITIDLNPSMQGYCGDYARSYYMEDGVVSRVPRLNSEFIAGGQAQHTLHAKLLQVAHPDMPFDALYQIIHAEIETLGFEQLAILGHNVGRNMQHMQYTYIAPAASMTLGHAQLFTLEPQIRLQGGDYGFKHENIYYFQGGELREL